MYYFQSAVSLNYSLNQKIPHIALTVIYKDIIMPSIRYYGISGWLFWVSLTITIIVNCMKSVSF